MSSERIEQMLRTYGDKAVLAAKLSAEKSCVPLSIYDEQLARHQGECRAWAVHDAYFGWEKPLANSFARLRSFVIKDAPPHISVAVTDWKSLHATAERVAVSFLGRMAYPPCPPLLSAEHYAYWWQLMAIMHECDRHTGK